MNLRQLVGKLFGPFEVTTTYGAPSATTGAPHYGIDIAAPYGTVVRAQEAGHVTDVRYDATGGYQVELQTASGFRERFAHLATVLVGRDQQVAIGDEIARTGASGQVTGPHLHVEAKTAAGAWVDPEQLFAIQAGATPAATQCPPKPEIVAKTFSLAGGGLNYAEMSARTGISPECIAEVYGPEQKRISDQAGDKLNDALQNAVTAGTSALSFIGIGLIVIILIAALAFMGLRKIADA